MHFARQANARSAPRKGVPRSFRPRLEPLEDRSMLAVMGLDIQLLDQDLMPLTRVDIEDHTGVSVGDVFYVQILAWDERGTASTAPGVVSLPLNLAWDPDVIEYIGENPDSDPGPNPDRVPSLSLADPVYSDLLTPDFTEQRFLTDYDATANDPTQLDGFRDPADGPTNANMLGLRGGAIPGAGSGAAIGTMVPAGGVVAQPTYFSRLQFRALTEASQMPFVMQLAGSMSFGDAAALDGIIHLIAGGVEENADADNRITEFLTITQNEPGPASLAGFVYVDANPMDNVLNRDSMGVPIEFGIPNVTISLFRDNQLIDTTTTGADGSYLFDDLEAGLYNIVETQPARFYSVSASVGIVLPSGESRGVVTSPDELSDITLALGDHGVDYNFGEGIIPDKRMFLARTDFHKIIASQQGVAARTIKGTSASDTIVVEPVGNALQVTINSQAPRQIPLSSARILYVDAGEGDDTIEFRGGAGNETAMLSPGAGTIRLGENYQGLGYALMALAAEHVVADGGGGDDMVVFRDTPNDDAFVAAGDEATLTSASRTAQAMAFERVRALSLERPSGTDNDTADVGATDYVLETVGKWQFI